MPIRNYVEGSYLQRGRRRACARISATARQWQASLQQLTWVRDVSREMRERPARALGLMLLSGTCANTVMLLAQHRMPGALGWTVRVLLVGAAWLALRGPADGTALTQHSLLVRWMWRGSARRRTQR